MIAKPANLAAGALIAMVLALCAFGFSQSFTESLWGHLKAGMDMLAIGHPIWRDTYSYISDIPWIDHEWLFEVILAACYKAGGLLGISLAKLAALELLFGLTILRLCQCKLPTLVTVLLTVLTSLVIAPALFAPRPGLFSLVFFAATLLVLFQCEQSSRKWLFALPLIFIPWCNIHGGFVSGLGVVAIWCFADIVENAIAAKAGDHAARVNIVTDIGGGLACFISTFINPYGWRLHEFLYRTLSLQRPEFNDWNPINVSTSIGASYFCVLAAATLILVFSPLKKSWKWLAIACVVALQPFAALRHVSFSVIALIFICAPHIAAILERWKPSFGRLSDLPNPLNWLLFAFGSLMTIGLLLSSLPLLHIIRPLNPVPLSAVSVIKNSGFRGNLAAPFDRADFCIWHLYPGVKVAEDWRRETVCSARAQAVNLEFTYGVGHWDDLLKQYPTDLVLTSRDYATFNLMKLDPDWQLCYEDGKYGIFAPKTSPYLERLRNSRPDPLLPLF